MRATTKGMANCAAPLAQRARRLAWALSCVAGISWPSSSGAAPANPHQPPAADLRLDDANCDRVVVFSTAETHPASALFFSDYEVLVLQLGYAFSDRTQVSVAALPRIFEYQPDFFDVVLKASVYRGRRFRAAVIGSGLTVLQREERTRLYPRLSGVGQFCFGPSCRNGVSLNAGTVLDTEYHRALPLLFGAGFIMHVGGVLSLLFEPGQVRLLRLGANDSSTTFVDYGVRLSGRQFGLDLTFIRPFTSLVDESGYGLGIPWIAFTVRSEPRPAPELERLSHRVATGDAM